MLCRCNERVPRLSAVDDMLGLELRLSLISYRSRAGCTLPRTTDDGLTGTYLLCADCIFSTKSRPAARGDAAEMKVVPHTQYRIRHARIDIQGLRKAVVRRVMDSMG